MVGYYDSIALAKYHEDLGKERKLTKSEEADRVANNTIMKAFESDMYDAYENKSGDISDVQKKYGYEEEELGVIQGLGEFAKMAVTSPGYTLGSLAGMIVKDPELLLLGYLRIPSLAAQGGIKASQLAQKAVNIRPKYMNKMVQLMRNERVSAGIGRGAEGATYGGVYEALHDLTFQGHIKSENVERGLAMGALLGTAFGAISKSKGKRSWLLSREGSKAVERNVRALEKAGAGKLKLRPVEGNNGAPALSWNAGWRAKLETARQKKIKEKVKDEAVANAEKIDNATGKGENREYRDPSQVASDAVLPAGLSHQARAELWTNRAIDLETSAKGALGGIVDVKTITERINIAIKKEAERLAKKKNKDGTRKYTDEEITGLSSKRIAKRIEKQSRHKDRVVKEGVGKGEKWGSKREEARGLEALEKGEFVRPKSSFSHIFKHTIEDLPKATVPQMAKYGAVTGGIGYYVSEDDKAFGSIIGMIAGAALRYKLSGINPSEAKMRRRVYEVASVSEGIHKYHRTQTQKTVDFIAKVLRGKDAKMSDMDFLSYVENYSGTHAKFGSSARQKLSQIEQDAIDSVRELMRLFRDSARKHDLFKDEQFINDYIAHIFKNKKFSKNSLSKIKNKLRDDGKLEDTSGHQQVRKLAGTVQELSKKYDIETDVFQILEAYSQSMSKAIAGKHMVSSLKNTAVFDKGKAIGFIIEKTGKNDKAWERAKELGYKVSNQKALENLMIHPLIKNSIDDYFQISTGTPMLMDKILKVNNALKRIAISLSFFHAQALVLSGIYSGVALHMLTPAGKAKRKTVMNIMKNRWERNDVVDLKTGEVLPKKNMTGEQRGQFYESEVLKELADVGVEISVKRNEFVDAGYNTMKAWVDSKIKPLGKAQDFVDRWTWDYIHDGAKIFTYLTVKERLMSSKPRGIAKLYKKGRAWKPLSEAEARESAAKFVNDAYGGQRHAKLALEWQDMAVKNASTPKGAMYHMFALATTPSKAKWSNMALFSPDWTVSNFRIAFKGLGMTKDLVTKSAKGKQLSPKEMAEFNLYMGYMLRGFISTSFLAYMMHSMLAESDIDFDLNDFWMTGRLHIGEGEEMVISKQIAEPMHWLTHPTNTLVNKSSILPKSLLALFLGKEYISLKHGGGYIGPTLNRADPKEMTSWGAGFVTPISINPLKRATLDAWLLDREYGDVGETTKKTVMGSVGFPIYHSNKK